ncbi:hypothetical protein VCHC59A1_1444A, partial [Vibrio cholerae HC-59A1]
MTYSFIHLA